MRKIFWYPASCPKTFISADADITPEKLRAEDILHKRNAVHKQEMKLEARRLTLERKLRLDEDRVKMQHTEKETMMRLMMQIIQKKLVDVAFVKAVCFNKKLITAYSLLDLYSELWWDAQKYKSLISTETYLPCHKIGFHSCPHFPHILFYRYHFF